jgi:hypothetical protein
MLILRASSLLVAAVALASTGCSIDVQGQESVLREQRRIPVTGTPRVTIRTFDGSIELRAWDRDEIMVDTERRAASAEDARNIKVELTEADGEVLIEARPPERRAFFLGHGISPRVRMLVTLPRQLSVDARTGDGAIMARDLDGAVDLVTGDGSVRLADLGGRIKVRTGDGAIAASDLRGSVSISTGDGSVNVSGRFDDLTVRTGDGAIDLQALPGSAMKSEWTVSSGDGSVQIFLPQDFNADIDAHTGDGGIRTEGIALLGPRQGGERRNKDIRGRVGSGGELLTVRTGDGSIDIAVR